MAVAHGPATRPGTTHDVQNDLDVLAPAKGDMLARVLRRERVTAVLGRLCARSAVCIRVAAPDGALLLGLGRLPAETDPDYLWGTAPICHAHATIATIAVAGSRPQVGETAQLVALWLEDLLVSEDEVGSLTQEVVHAYEELHVLYGLGKALGGVLDVRAAGELIVRTVLAPLGAAHALLLVTHQGHEELVARATSQVMPTASGNPDARATATLQVNGEPIGSLVLEGTLSGTDFRSSELKLLQGIASVAAPAIYAAQLYEAARRQADTDGLTGVHNHRRVQERLDEELNRARRYGHPLTIILADLDNFKLFNDVYGHPVGDRVLLTVTQCIAGNVRACDVVGRYGGDEFLLILPETDLDGALVLAERLLDAIADHDVVVNGERLPIGISLGVASFPVDATTKHELIAHADTALYESKHSGGRTVRHARAGRADWIKLQNNTFGVLEGLVQSIDAKDHYTREHSEIVTEAALVLAEHLNLSEEVRRALRIAGLLHDVGKIGIPDHVLKKPGKLSAEEYEIMKQHVQLSEMMIKNVPYLTDVLDAVAHHHERYDGKGYPYGKRQDDIPLLGRIMAVADAYSAMCLDRPYRKGLDWAEIRAEMELCAGKQFDPRLVPIFIAAMEKVHGGELPTQLAPQAPLSSKE